MTAAASIPDGELAVRAASGDRDALAQIYDRFAPRLWAFCFDMLRSRADAEDCLQDVFVTAATRMTTLREPDRLRTWLYAIARRQCLDRLAKGKRELMVEDVADAVGADEHLAAGDRLEDPAANALDRELVRLVEAVWQGLPDRDRLVLDLADRQGLSTDEVARIIDASPATTYKLIVRARETARKSLGALLVARDNHGACAELDAILAGWDGTLTPLLRKRIVRHVESCAQCGEKERRLATPAALLGAVIVIPLRAGLRGHVVGHAAAVHAAAAHGAGAGLAAAGQAGWQAGWPQASTALKVGHGTAIKAGAAALVVAAAATVVTLVAVHSDSSPTASASGPPTPTASVGAPATGGGAPSTASAGPTTPGPVSTATGGALTVGTRTTGTVSGGVTRTYTFSGTAGQVFYLEGGGTRCDAAIVRVDDPTGAEVGRSPACGDVGRVAVDRAGTYSVTAESVAGSGSYTLDLLAVPADITGTAAAGTPVTGRIAAPGQLARYTFSGTAGSTLTLKTTTTSCDLVWQITGPGGDETTTHQLACVDLTGIHLTKDGTYTITVSGSGRATGAYGFTRTS